jgi:pyruvate/2-oxoglutarate dehydrogenase complex dihydrolipoamide acyltransferase (E2) component
MNRKIDMPEVQEPLAARVAVLCIPQLGEGQRTVKVVALLKGVGDPIELDEPVYEVETDKATVAIESPHAGILKGWLAEVGQSVDVHAPIAHVEVRGNGTNQGAFEIPRSEPRAIAPGQTETRIPPRTRAFCRRHGLSDEAIKSIPAQGRMLTEEDVLRYLDPDTGHSRISAHEDKPFEDYALSERQKALNRAALYGRPDQPLPATVRYALNWDVVERAVAAGRRAHPELAPTEFQVLAYCAAKSAISNPKCRSRLLDSGSARQYANLNLGFAVSLPDDELCTATVEAADTLDLQAFIRAMRSRQRLARRSGETQADESTTLILSSLRSREIIDATPILVPPAVAVLFFGHPILLGDTLSFSMTLTFDHRLINGAGAERYLSSIAACLARV